jgi:quercetin dioxygenase-like cupin family protein
MTTAHDGVLNFAMRVFDVQAGTSTPVHTHA